MSTQPYHNRGFTLIETMVAITILAVALIGPFAAVQNALVGSYVARDQLVASALAQEGIEYIRSVRDNNYLSRATRPGGWLDGFSTYTQCYSSSIGVTPSGYCTVDPRLGDFHSNSLAMQGYTAAQVTGTPSLITLLLDPTNFFYNHQTGTATTFKRTVRIKTLSTHEVQVIVQVTWITSKQTYSVTVTDNIQDWI